MAGWTGQQNIPTDDLFLIKSRLLAQTCLRYLVYINILAKNTNARTTELRAFQFSVVIPKKTVLISRKGAWMVGYDDLSVWLALKRMKCVPAASLLYIYAFKSISDFCPNLKKYFLVLLLGLAQSLLSGLVNTVLLKSLWHNGLCFKLTTQVSKSVRLCLNLSKPATVLFHLVTAFPNELIVHWYTLCHCTLQCFTPLWFAALQNF